MNIHVLGDGCLHINTFLDESRDNFDLQKISISPGGSATNIARQLNKLDVSVKFHALIGEDELGSLYCSLLEREGISTEYIKHAGRTTKVLIGLNKHGNTKLTVDAQPVDVKKMSDNLSLIEENDLVYIPGFPNYEDLINSLTNKKITLFSDIGFIPYSSDWSVYKEKIVALSKKVDVILASGFSFEQELFQDLQKEIKESRCKELIITFGNKGVMLVNQKGVSYIQTKSVKEINSIGAGDCFFAGIIHGHLNNLSFSEKVKQAQIIAAIKIQELDIIPSLEEVKQHL